MTHPPIPYKLIPFALFALFAVQSPLAQTTRLAWDPVPEYWISGYHVYRAPLAAGPWQRVNPELVEEPWFVDDTVDYGETWHYAVTAVNSFGAESPRSTPLAVTVPGPLLAVDLGPDREVAAADVVTLTAQPTGPLAGLGFSWRQMLGPEVPWATPSPGVLTLVAPEVDQPTVLEFQVTVTDGWGRQASASIQITVRPRS